MAGSAPRFFFCYMLRCGDGSLYTGYTDDPVERLKRHNSGKGAKYTRSRGPCQAVYLEPFFGKTEAMSREWQIKHTLSHAEKEALCAIPEQRLVSTCMDRFGIVPDMPFSSDSRSWVFRHPDSRKWFALIMDVDASKLGIQGDLLRVVNLRVDPALQQSLMRGETGILLGWHMNHSRWCSVILDGRVEERKVLCMLEMSYQLTDR